jgi:hypothetical protein
MRWHILIYVYPDTACTVPSYVSLDVLQVDGAAQDLQYTNSTTYLTESLSPPNGTLYLQTCEHESVQSYTILNQNLLMVVT